MSHLSILIPIYALSFSNNKTNEKPTKNQQISNIVPYLLTLHTYTVNTSHNTQPQHTAPATSKKHRNHDLRPPASSGFNFTGECDRRTSCDRYRSPQYGDAIFLMKRTVSFYFIDYYYRPLTGVHWDKRYVFLVNTCAFFGRCIESMRTDPSYPTIYFLPVPPSPHHVLA